jgi:hypothetical protein
LLVEELCADEVWDDDDDDDNELGPDETLLSELPTLDILMFDAELDPPESLVEDRDIEDAPSDDDFELREDDSGGVIVGVLVGVAEGVAVGVTVGVAVGV